MNELALFAGGGGGILGGKLLGWRTVCAVEIDEYCRRVLLARQDDGSLEPFPIWDDACTFDGKPWRGVVDVVTGGFPCQDISPAGKRAGITGARSGLWKQMSRIIGEARPKFALIENSSHLKSKGLDVVLDDLARMGYDAQWGVVGAEAAGAPHVRKRMWILATDANHGRQRAFALDGEVAGAQALCDVGGEALWLATGGGARKKRPPAPRLRGRDWWPAPLAPRVDHGVAHRMDRVRATGNGQVAPLVPIVWRLLGEIEEI